MKAKYMRKGEEIKRNKENIHNWIAYQYSFNLEIINRWNITVNQEKSNLEKSGFNVENFANQTRYRKKSGSLSQRVIARRRLQPSGQKNEEPGWEKN